VLSPAAVAPALLERHKAALRSYVQALTKGDAAKVEAVVEAVWLEAQAAENAEFEEDPTVWLFTNARRRVVGSGAREAFANDEGGSGPGEDETGHEGEEPRVVVHRTISSLTPKQQEALRLKFQFNLSLDEMADITGQAKAGTGGLLHHAIVRIGKALGGRDDDASPLASDPRVTAYALDEMDASERSYFEKGIANGQALLEREKAIRGWGGHITEVLSSGAPVPKRRRKKRGAAWWKSRALWLSLVLATVVAVFWTGRQKFADRAGREDMSRASGPADGAAGSQPGADENDRTPVVGGGVAAAEGNTSPPAKPPSAAATRQADESGVTSRRRSEKSSAHANQEAVKSSASGGQGDDFFRRNTDESMPALILNPETFVEKPAAAGSSAAGRAGTAARNPTPAGAGNNEARKNIDLVKDQPGKGKAAEEIDVIPAMGGVQWQLALKQWPKREQVRLEEMLKFAPPPGRRPASHHPVEAQQEMVRSPWDARKQIVRVSLRAKDSPAPARGPANLVFAIDVSQSMAGPNRLPLVQEGVRRLVDRLRPDDRISVVTYATKADLALAALPADRSGELRGCLAGLEAAGLTDGSAGLRLAYETARRNRVEGGLNVVVLCTDGNFNLGTTDESELAALAAAQSQNGIQLSVFGFGRTDRNDLRLEILATNGGGRSCYVNTEEEAERQLVAQIDGLFAPVARDVHLQVAFNPARVEGYQRIGDVSDQDTAGTVAALLPGRSVTAMFEVMPKFGMSDQEALGRLQLGYTLPETGERQQQAAVLSGTGRTWAGTGMEFRFAIAMAEFGRILRNGRPADTTELDRLEGWVRENLADDAGGYRTELLQNLALARAVVQSQSTGTEAK